MPSNYSGLAGNIAPPAALAVTGAAGTPITITTSTAHGLTTGDTVDVSEVRGNTAANGIWVVTVTGGSTFTIPPATSGAYSAGAGSVQSLAVGAPAAIPSAGDAGTAVSVDTMFKRLSDQTAFLGRGAGGFKLAKRQSFYRVNSLSGNTSWAAAVAHAATVGSTAQLTTGAGLSWLTTGYGSPATPVAGQPPVFFMDGVVAGDQLVITLDTTYNFDTTAMLALYQANQAEAVTPTWPTDYSGVFGTPRVLTGDSSLHSVSMRGLMPTIGQTGDLYIQPAVFGLSNSTQNYTLYGDAVLSVEVWRPTTMPQ